MTWKYTFIVMANIEWYRFYIYIYRLLYGLSSHLRRSARELVHLHLLATQPGRYVGILWLKNCPNVAIFRTVDDWSSSRRLLTWLFLVHVSSGSNMFKAKTSLRTGNRARGFTFFLPNLSFVIAKLSFWSLKISRKMDPFSEGFFIKCLFRCSEMQISV